MPAVLFFRVKNVDFLLAAKRDMARHVDAIFHIVNGTKVYIQAILDNASRHVLAWQVTQDYGGANTKALIEKALEVANRISGNVGIPNLFADDGTESQNKDVDSLV